MCICARVCLFCSSCTLSAYCDMRQHIQDGHRSVFVSSKHSTPEESAHWVFAREVATPTCTQFHFTFLPCINSICLLNSSCVFLQCRFLASLSTSRRTSLDRESLFVVAGKAKVTLQSDSWEKLQRPDNTVSAPFSNILPFSGAPTSLQERDDFLDFISLVHFLNYLCTFQTHHHSIDS